ISKSETNPKLQSNDENPKRVCLEISDSDPFEIVSNFGFRVSNLFLVSPSSFRGPCLRQLLPWNILALSPFASGRKACGGVAEHSSVADAEGFDPSLLSQGQGDEKSEFDQLGYGEVLMKLLPKRVIRDVGVPGDGAGIGKCDFFSLGKFIRIFE